MWNSIFRDRSETFSKSSLSSLLAGVPAPHTAALDTDGISKVPHDI